MSETQSRLKELKRRRNIENRALFYDIDVNIKNIEDDSYSVLNPLNHNLRMILLERRKYIEQLRLFKENNLDNIKGGDSYQIALDMIMNLNERIIVILGL